MKIIFSLGGSVVAPDNIDKKFLTLVSSFMADLSTCNQLGIVVGGGAPARRRIAEVRKNGASEAECDYEGILATRDNATAVIKSLGGKASLKIPASVHEAAKLFGRKILVMGGTEPGHSTDAVAALLAEWVKADLLINASNVDAVYDKDPKKFKDAKSLRSINIDDLIKLLEGQSVAAGHYPLLDPSSLKLIKRSRLKTIVLNGRDLSNMRNALDGREYKGTVITFD